MDPLTGEPEGRGESPTALEFPGGHQAVAVWAGPGKGAADLLGELGIERPAPAVLVLGGADDLDPAVIPRLTVLFADGVAPAASAARAVVVDGGTRSGVMAVNGAAMAARAPRSVVLGVAPGAAVTWPGRNDVTDGAVPLDPNHSHFVLADSAEWGGETTLLFDLVEELSTGRPAVAVLAGGGEVAKEETVRAVRRRFPLIVLEGSGGAADAVAAALVARSRRISEPPADRVLDEIVAEGSIRAFPLDGDPNALAGLLARHLEQDEALHMAWQQFALLDQAAKRQQTAFRRQQGRILALGLVATTLALTQTTLRQHGVLDGRAWLARPLHYAILLVPIVLAALAAAAGRFRPGGRWVLLRGSAESIKREIYRYRARAGVYGSGHTSKVPREVKLAEMVGGVLGTLMRTEVNLAALDAYGDRLPPENAAADGDDGTSPLTPRRYITHRIDDQLGFYRGKVTKLERRLRRLRWGMFAVGGLGTFLAAIGLELWIALTTAVAGVLASYLETEQTETTVTLYNQAAADLVAIRAWWIALSPEVQGRQENIDRLVTSAERIMQAEQTGWVQEMQDAIAQLRLDDEPASS